LITPHPAALQPPSPRGEGFKESKKIFKDFKDFFL
jgi:hypothetical protein